MNRKDEIITGLVEARRKILDVASDLSPEKQDEIFLGVWNIKDLLAHLVGWDYTNIESIEDIRSGESLRIFEQYDPDWAQYNADLVEKYGEEDFGKLLEAIQRSHQELIKFIERIPTDDLEKDFGVRAPNGENITVESVLQFEIEDEGRHLQQILEWLGL
jgi:hypothetical protein